MTTQSKLEPASAKGLVNEFALIDKYFAPLAGEGAFDLKDDAALLKPRPGHELVISQDAIHQGVHFFDDTPLDLVARRAIRCNISDIIAKGATPVSYSLALGLPSHVTGNDVALLAKGLQEDQGFYGVYLSGGDTYASGSKLTLAVTMLGEVPTGGYVSRLSAQPGDVICVTGCIGDAHLGLTARLKGLDTASSPHLAILRQRQELPKPPFDIQSVIRKFANAAMDVSDGFVGDLRKLCDVSKLSARIEFDDVPISKDAAMAIDAGLFTPADRIAMLTGGDDYQTLFTLPPDRFEPARNAAAKLGITVTKVGEMNAKSAGEVVVVRSGVPMSIEHDSYVHF